MIKELKNLIELGCEVQIFVPSTQDVNLPINNSIKVEETLFFLSKLFGGSTSQEAIGCWTTADDTIVKEKVTICYSNCNSEQLNNHVIKVIEYCEKLKKDMQQEAVSMKINGKLYLV